MDLDAFRPAAALHAQGRLVEAEAAYRALLEGPPEQVGMAHQLIGMVKADGGDPAAAIAEYQAALDLGWRTPELMFSRGEALRSLHRTAEALESYEGAVTLRPAYAEAQHLAGVCLAALGRTQEAVGRYREAVSLAPDARQPWNNLGVALEALGWLDEALGAYERALAVDPTYLQALHNRGSVLLTLGRLEEAVAAFDAVKALNPAIPETWNLRAVALAKLDRPAEALQSAERAVSLRPDYAEAHNNRSVALRTLKLYEDALVAADQALAYRPAFAEALNSRGSALAKLNRNAEAKASYDDALALSPDHAGLHLNLGFALEALGDLEGADRAFAASEAIASDKPDAAFARGLVRIRSGDILEGFRLYESRWLQKNGPELAYPRETLWLGETPLGTRRLLVHSEQGFGDTLQFCRFAPLAAPPEQLILQVQPQLRRVISTLKGAPEVCDYDHPADQWDVHIPIMSLTWALKLSLGQVSPISPYLFADPGLVERWRARLPSTDRPRVGLAWTGNPKHENDHNRSLTFETLRPLLGEPAQFIGLQAVYRDADLSLMNETPELLRFDDTIEDFADTAALAALCDVVIAVDTSVAHLAGALGRPLCLLLPHFCDWRWMNERADTPWYPSATLYRQSAPGDWSAVMQALAARLRASETRAEETSV